MAPMPSIKIVKSFPYRGGTQEWSNRIYFRPDQPTTDGEWNTLADMVVAAEKLCHTSRTTFVRVDCYEPGSDRPIHTRAASGTGSYVPAGGAWPPGDVCAVIRYETGDRSVKNHPIYLFSYMHFPILDTSNPDLLLPAHKTLYEAYALKWTNDTFGDGTRTYNRCSPSGATALSRSVNQYVSHRDFPR